MKHTTAILIGITIGIVICTCIDTVSKLLPPFPEPFKAVHKGGNNEYDEHDLINKVKDISKELFDKQNLPENDQDKVFFSSYLYIPETVIRTSGIIDSNKFEKKMSEVKNEIKASDETFVKIINEMGNEIQIQIENENEIKIEEND